MSKSSAAREARDLVHEAERQGWRVRDNGAHHTLYAPNGRHVHRHHREDAERPPLARKRDRGTPAVRFQGLNGGID